MADVKIDGQTYTDVDMLNLEDTDGNEVKYYNDENLQLDYSKQITGKPKINGAELDGDKTLEELGISEEYELIYDFAIEEDVTKISLTNLNHKKLTIIINGHAFKAENPEQMYQTCSLLCYINPYDIKTGQVYNTRQLFYVLNSFYKVKSNIKTRLMLSINEDGTANGYAKNIMANSGESGIMHSSYAFNMNNKAINEVWIEISSAFRFKAGTTVKVYGVKY